MMEQREIGQVQEQAAPERKKRKKGTGTWWKVLLAVALSLCLRYVPLFSGISSGFAVILCAVIASAMGALLHPVKEAHAP